MFVTGIVPFFLYLSIIINLFLAWYSMVCLVRANDIEEDMILLMKKNEAFLDDLENIYSLEMYYGDEYLQNLISHSRHLVNDFIDIQENYFDVEIADIEEEEENEEEGHTPQEE